MNFKVGYLPEDRCNYNEAALPCQYLSVGRFESNEQYALLAEASFQPIHQFSLYAYEFKVQFLSRTLWRLYRCAELFYAKVVLFLAARSCQRGRLIWGASQFLQAAKQSRAVRTSIASKGAVKDEGYILKCRLQQYVCCAEHLRWIDWTLYLNLKNCWSLSCTSFAWAQSFAVQWWFFHPSLNHQWPV